MRKLLILLALFAALSVRGRDFDSIEEKAKFISITEKVAVITITNSDTVIYRTVNIALGEVFVFEFPENISLTETPTVGDAGLLKIEVETEPLKNQGALGHTLADPAHLPGHHTLHNAREARHPQGRLLHVAQPGRGDHRPCDILHHEPRRPDRLREAQRTARVRSASDAHRDARRRGGPPPPRLPVHVGSVLRDERAVYGGELGVSGQWLVVSG